MAKYKCEDCRYVHGGFHLCLKGASTEVEWKAPKRPRQITESTRERMRVSSRARWDRAYAEREQRDNDILAMYKQKIPYDKISAEMGVSHGLVAKVVKTAADEGLAEPPKLGRKVTEYPPDIPELRADVIKAYEQDGLTMDQVNALTGVSPHFVRKILREAAAEGLVTIRPRAPYSSNRK